MKLMTVVGARPQFVKAAAVSRAIRAHNADHPGDTIRECVVHTGQHFDAAMSGIFFEQLDIPLPDHNLGVASLDHGAMTGRMLERLESLASGERPDILLVYGDTNSTLAGALAAAKLQIPVAHVEAGLRAHNPAMPEEINRVLTDRLSSILFCPTDTAVRNLAAEGYPFPCNGLAPSPHAVPDLGAAEVTGSLAAVGTSSDVRRTGSEKMLQRIVKAGDVMYDVALHYSDLARRSLGLSRWGLDERGYALCTLHRAENTDDPSRLGGILAALREIAREYRVVLPLHPRTRKSLESMAKLDWLAGLDVLAPLPYLEMLRLQMSADVILTDSGGMQKEALFHSVPCITLRDETEWQETLELGWNRLAGASRERIVAAWREQGRPQAQSCLPFGDGNAAGAIVQVLWETGRRPTARNR